MFWMGRCQGWVFRRHGSWEKRGIGVLGRGVGNMQTAPAPQVPAPFSVYFHLPTSCSASAGAPATQARRRRPSLPPTPLPVHEDQETPFWVW